MINNNYLRYTGGGGLETLQKKYDVTLTINNTQVNCYIYLGNIFRKDNNEIVTEHVVNNITKEIVYKMFDSVGINEANTIIDTHISHLIKKECVFYRKRAIFQQYILPDEFVLFFIDKDKQKFYILDNKYRWFEKHTLGDRNDYICNKLIRMMAKNIICPESQHLNYFIDRIDNFTLYHGIRSYAKLKFNMICGAVDVNICVPHIDPNYKPTIKITGTTKYATSFDIYDGSYYGFGRIKGDGYLKKLHNHQINILGTTEYCIYDNHILFMIYSDGVEGVNNGHINIHGRNYYGSTSFLRDWAIYDMNTCELHLLDIWMFEKYERYNMFETYFKSLPMYKNTVYVTQKEWETGY